MWGITRDGSLCRTLSEKVIMKIGRDGTMRLASKDEFFHAIVLDNFDNVMIKGLACLEHEGFTYNIQHADEMFEAYGSEVKVGIFEEGDVVMAIHDKSMFFAYLDGEFKVYDGLECVATYSSIPFDGKLMENKFQDVLLEILVPGLKELSFEKIEKDDNGAITIS